jgi:transposase
MGSLIRWLDMGTTALSDDLRSRVIAEILAGALRRQAAERFKVSAASAVRWAQLHSQTGGIGPRPRGGKSRSPLEPHAAWLLDLTTAEPDLTLEAIVQRLLAGLGLKKAAVRRFFKRHAITFKKKLHATEQDRADVSLARERWKASQASLDPTNWCSSTRRAPTPRWSDVYGRCRRASGSSVGPRGVIGRPQPSPAACAATVWSRPGCGKVP